MSDEIHTGGGSHIGGDVETGGGDMTGRDRRSDQRQNVNVRAGQETQYLWIAIADLSQKLDDLPNRVNKLEAQVLLTSRPIPWIGIVLITLFVVLTFSAVALTAYTTQQLAALNALHDEQSQRMEALEAEVRDLNGRFGALVYMVMPPKADVLRDDSEPWPAPTLPTQAPP